MGTWMVALASPLAVVVLADLALLQLWTVGLFWKHGGGVDWTFLRAPFDSRYGAVTVVFGLYALVALLAHGGLWLVAGTTEMPPGNLIGAVSTVAVGLYLLIGTSNMYPDVEELREPPVEDAVAARERFGQNWIRGIGWTFLTVATTTVAVTRTFGPIVW